MRVHPCGALIDIPLTEAHVSTDWNQKLAWALRDLPDPNFDLLQLSAHRSALLGTADVTLDVGPRADWVASSADRVPFPSGTSAARAQVDWAAHPEVTHPIAKLHHAVEPIDLEAARKVVGELLAECATRFDRDARRTLLWMWRYLPERLASAAGGPGPIASQIPADPRLPNLSVWQRLSFDTALAAASPAPTFLVLQITPPDAALGEATTLEDLWVISNTAAELAWQTLLPILETLGPASVLSPSLRFHPKADAWLAEQGVTASEEVTPPAPCPAVAGCLPSLIVALVPADQAKELGEACKKKFDEAWSRAVGAVRDKLVKAKWVKQGNEAWTSTWSRQTSRAWEMHWTAVGWGDDSTGAGSLLPKQDVTVLEKWARVHEDATGLEDPWPGIFYGLWFSAALTASSARQRLGSVSVLSEPAPPCTSCGHREALHDGNGEGTEVDAFWKPIVGPKGKASGAVQPGESLCAVCTMRRMAGAVGEVSVPKGLGALGGTDDTYALVVFSLDQPLALLRGGKDLKQVATLADSVHGELDKTFTKRARAQVKEILDTPPYLGPARHLAVQEALDDFLSAMPALLEKFGAFALQATDREVIVVAPSSQAYGLVRALRTQQQEGFVEVATASGKRLASRAGALATSSGVVAIVPRSEVPGALLQDCRALLQDVARGPLGGDALVIMRRSRHEEERVFAARWNDLAASMDVLLQAVPTRSKLHCLAQEMANVAPALSNIDLDKTSPSARASLAAGAIEELGLGADQDYETLARAVCQIVDHCVRLPGGTEENHALDGLHIAASLCGADQ
jgi:hypothetical protein